MTDDEKQIRQLTQDWLEASKKGDLAALLDLMDQKVIFLATGQKPMEGRDAFGDAFSTGSKHYSFAATNEIKEIEVMGDWAYSSSTLHISINPHDERIPKAERRGPTLTIYKRQSDGRWALYRDANMLMVEEKPKNRAWVKNPTPEEHI